MASANHAFSRLVESSGQSLRRIAELKPRQAE
jgi:hypothetical protein